jgi:hypothetical protein
VPTQAAKRQSERSWISMPHKTSMVKVSKGRDLWQSSLFSFDAAHFPLLLLGLCRFGISGGSA